jgi:hypothetical protein
VTSRSSTTTPPVASSSVVSMPSNASKTSPLAPADPVSPVRSPAGTPSSRIARTSSVPASCALLSPARGNDISSALPSALGTISGGRPPSA